MWNVILDMIYIFHHAMESSVRNSNYQNSLCLYYIHVLHSISDILIHISISFPVANSWCFMWSKQFCLILCLHVLLRKKSKIWRNSMIVIGLVSWYVYFLLLLLYLNEILSSCAFLLFFHLTLEIVRSILVRASAYIYVMKVNGVYSFRMIVCNV